MPSAFNPADEPLDTPSFGAGDTPVAAAPESFGQGDTPVSSPTPTPPSRWGPTQALQDVANFPKYALLQGTKTVLSAAEAELNAMKPRQSVLGQAMQAAIPGVNVGAMLSQIPAVDRVRQAAVAGLEHQRDVATAGEQVFRAQNPVLGVAEPYVTQGVPLALAPEAAPLIIGAQQGTDTYDAAERALRQQGNPNAKDIATGAGLAAGAAAAAIAKIPGKGASRMPQRLIQGAMFPVPGYVAEHVATGEPMDPLELLKRQAASAITNEGAHQAIGGVSALAARGLETANNRAQSRAEVAQTEALDDAGFFGRLARSDEALNEYTNARNAAVTPPFPQYEEFQTSPEQQSTAADAQTLGVKDMRPIDPERPIDATPPATAEQLNEMGLRRWQAIAEKDELMADTARDIKGRLNEQVGRQEAVAQAENDQRLDQQRAAEQAEYDYENARATEAARAEAGTKDDGYTISPARYMRHVRGHMISGDEGLGHQATDLMAQDTRASELLRERQEFAQEHAEAEHMADAAAIKGENEDANRLAFQRGQPPVEGDVSAEEHRRQASEAQAVAERHKSERLSRVYSEEQLAGMDRTTLLRIAEDHGVPYDPNKGITARHILDAQTRRQLDQLNDRVLYRMAKDAGLSAGPRERNLQALTEYMWPLRGQTLRIPGIRDAVGEVGGEGAGEGGGPTGPGGGGGGPSGTPAPGTPQAPVPGATAEEPTGDRASVQSEVQTAPQPEPTERSRAKPAPPSPTVPGLSPEPAEAGKMENPVGGKSVVPTGRQLRQEWNPVLDRADEGLSPEAQRAVTEFVGHGPRGRDTADEMGLPIMSAGRLEDAFSTSPSTGGRQVRQEIESAFAPVREQLRQRFGDTVRLYRHQGEVKPGSARRNVLSWTMDPRVAREQFAGAHDVRVPTDAEVAAAFDEYTRTGKTKFYGHEYEASEEYPGSVDMYQPADDYGEREHITDAGTTPEEFREHLAERQRELADLKAEHDERAKSVQVRDVPLSDVVWATNRANQMEFIVRERPTLAQSIADVAKKLGIRGGAEPTATEAPDGVQEQGAGEVLQREPAGVHEAGAGGEAGPAPAEEEVAAPAPAPAKPTFEEHLATLNAAYKRKLDGIRLQVSEKKGGGKVDLGNGKYAIISREPGPERDKYPWRATYFDQRGPWGHETYKAFDGGEEDTGAYPNGAVQGVAGHMSVTPAEEASALAEFNQYDTGEPPATAAPAQEQTPAASTGGAAPAQPHYINGDAVEYTGNRSADGFYEFTYLDGAKKGQTGVTARGPDGSDPYSERNKAEWQDQQEQFRRLNKPEPATPEPEKPPTAAEALAKGMTFQQWRAALDDAFLNGRIGEDDPAWLERNKYQPRSFEGQKWVGKDVVVKPVHTSETWRGTVESAGIHEESGNGTVTVRHEDGRTSINLTDSLLTPEQWEKDQAKRAERHAAIPAPAEPEAPAPQKKQRKAKAPDPAPKPAPKVDASGRPPIESVKLSTEGKNFPQQQEQAGLEAAMNKVRDTRRAALKAMDDRVQDAIEDPAAVHQVLKDRIDAALAKAREGGRRITKVRVEAITASEARDFLRDNDAKYQKASSAWNAAEQRLGELDDRAGELRRLSGEHATAYHETRQQAFKDQIKQYPWWEVRKALAGEHWTPEETALAEDAYKTMGESPTLSDVKGPREGEVLPEDYDYSDRKDYRPTVPFRGEAGKQADRATKEGIVPTSIGMPRGPRQLLNDAKVPPTHEAEVVSVDAYRKEGHAAALGKGAPSPDQMKRVDQSFTKFKDFIRLVPEFKIDPKFVYRFTPKEGVERLEFQDGGKYRFDPHALGVLLPEGIKDGDTVRVDPDAVLKAKGDNLIVAKPVGGGEASTDPDVLRNRAVGEQIRTAAWQKTSFKAAMKEGPTEVKGETLGDGLVVHKSVQTGKRGTNWQVSHAASGLNMGFGFDTAQDAKAFAVRASPLTDWTQDGESLGKQISDNPDFKEAIGKLSRDPYADISDLKLPEKPAAPTTGGGNNRQRPGGFVALPDVGPAVGEVRRLRERFSGIEQQDNPAVARAFLDRATVPDQAGSMERAFAGKAFGTDEQAYKDWLELGYHYRGQLLRSRGQPAPGLPTLSPGEVSRRLADPKIRAAIDTFNREYRPGIEDIRVRNGLPMDPAAGTVPFFLNLPTESDPVTGQDSAVGFGKSFDRPATGGSEYANDPHEAVRRIFGGHLKTDTAARLEAEVRKLSIDPAKVVDPGGTRNPAQFQQPKDDAFVGPYKGKQVRVGVVDLNAGKTITPAAIKSGKLPASLWPKVGQPMPPDYHYVPERVAKEMNGFRQEPGDWDTLFDKFMRGLTRVGLVGDFAPHSARVVAAVGQRLAQSGYGGASMLPSWMGSNEAAIGRMRDMAGTPIGEAVQVLIDRSGASRGSAYGIKPAKTKAGKILNLPHDWLMDPEHGVDPTARRVVADSYLRVMLGHEAMDAVEADLKAGTVTPREAADDLAGRLSDKDLIGLGRRVNDTLGYSNRQTRSDLLNWAQRVLPFLSSESGMIPNEAVRLATGNINPAEIARSVQAGRYGQAAKQTIGSLATGAVGVYLLMNALNYASTKMTRGQGRWLDENDEGHKLDVEVAPNWFWSNIDPGLSRAARMLGLKSLMNKQTPHPGIEAANEGMSILGGGLRLAFAGLTGRQLHMNDDGTLMKSTLGQLSPLGAGRNLAKSGGQNMGAAAVQDVASLAGVNLQRSSGANYTDAERAAHEMVVKNVGGRETSAAERDRHKATEELMGRLRAAPEEERGKIVDEAVLSGKAERREKSNLLKKAKQTDLQRWTDELTVDQAAKLYADPKMTGPERDSIREQVQKKILASGKSEDQQDAMLAKAGITPPPELPLDRAYHALASRRSETSRLGTEWETLNRQREAAVLRKDDAGRRSLERRLNALADEHDAKDLDDDERGRLSDLEQARQDVKEVRDAVEAGQLDRATADRLIGDYVKGKLNPEPEPAGAQ